MFMNVPKSGYNTYFIYSSSCVIYKITNINALVNGFFIFPSYIFIILFLFINILYLNLKFIDFMGIFLYIYVIYFHIIRFIAAFINLCISFTYKILPYHFNNFHICQYDINLHRIRTSIFDTIFTDSTN